MIKTSIANIVLRGLTLVSRFVLLFFIARFLTPEELGVWGLMNITVVMSLYFLGLDFYVFNTREILAVDDARRVPFIRDQIVFHALLYVVALPLLLVVFFAKLISWQYLGWFYVLLVLEHISQEATRLLITLSRPSMANMIMFLRSGAWVYAAVLACLYHEDLRGLSLIWSGWVVGVMASIILAIYALRYLAWDLTKQVPIDWTWIRKGVKVSLPFLLASLSFTGVQYADRYFLQHFHGEAVVGVYTFFASIANVIHIFIFTGVMMILYPRIIEAYQHDRFDEYRALMRKMGLGIAGGVVLLTALALLLIDPVLHLVGKQVYSEQGGVFVIMLASVAMLTFSYIPHYSLFVRKCDKSIIVSTVVALIVAVILNSLLVPRYGLFGAAYATLGAMIILLLLKTIAALNSTGGGRTIMKRLWTSISPGRDTQQGAHRN